MRGGQRTGGAPSPLLVPFLPRPTWAPSAAAQAPGDRAAALGRRGPAPAASPGPSEEEEEEEEEEEPWTPPLALAALLAGRPGDSAQGGRANRTEAPADFFARKPAFSEAKPPGPPRTPNPSSPSHRGSRSRAPPRLQSCSAAHPRSPPQPPARLGTARHGSARLGTARHGSAWLGTHLLRGASRVEARARRLPRRVAR
nr:atherin-like isoform X2 [Anas platyrhynchos]